MSESTLERLSALSRTERDELLADEARKANVSPERIRAMLLGSWRFEGRPKQQPPSGDWFFWFLLCGRGFGKTRSASQWVKVKALERRCRVAVVAPTFRDVRATCFEGKTGLLSVIPTSALLGQSRAVAWNRTSLELTMANGSLISGFSSDAPERLRGPEHDYAWGEEVSSWLDAKYGDVMGSTFSNMKLGLRGGDSPQVVLTSTPKVNKLTRELVALDGGPLVMVRGSSYENRVNLPDAWWDSVVLPMENTRTGRQEIEAELLEDVEGALWTRAMIDALRVPDYPDLMRIVVGVDPNTTSGVAADAAGIVVAGMGFRDKHGYVLDDRTQTSGGPRAWAQAAVDAYHDWHADAIVVEVNNGGEMCEEMLRAIDRRVRVKMVRASRGKRTRAEPVSMLYEQDEDREKYGRVHHVGVGADFNLEALEDEMVTWTPAEESPGRMDALVWAITELDVGRPPSAQRGSHIPQGEIPGVVDRSADLGYTV